MERHELYNGNVVMHYYDDDHKYLYDGEQLPSSTTITGILSKPALRYWYINKALERVEARLTPGVALNEIEIQNLLKYAKYGGGDARDEAASVGRIVHDWIEQYVSSQIAGGHQRPPLPIHTGAQSSVESFLRWEEDAKPEYVFSERRMLSLEHRFCGTLDIACLLDGKPTVVDIKTGKAVYPEYWLQTASYCLMLAEEQPKGFAYPLDDMERLILLVTQATGKLKPVSPDSSVLDDAETFAALRKVYRWREGI